MNISSGLPIQSLKALSSTGVLESLMLKLFDRSSVGLVLIGTDRTILDASKGFCKMFSYTNDELVGKNIKILSHPDDIAKTNRFIKESVSPLTTISPLEKRYIKKNGEILWGRVRIEKVVEENHGNLCSLVIIEDISDFREQEEAFKKVLQITSKVPSMLAYINRNYHYEYVNETYEEFYQKKSSSFIGLTVAEIIGEDVWKKAKTYLDQVLAELKPMQFENVILNAEKESRTVMVNLEPDIDSEGEVKGFFIHVVDLTDIKKAEELLNQDNNDLLLNDNNANRMMEASPDTVLVCDLNGEILFVNSRIKEMFGYEKSEVVGLSVELLVPSALRSGHQAKIGIYRNTPLVRRIKSESGLLGQKKNGRLIPLDIGLSPIQYDDQDAVLATIRDVKEVREEMQANEQLAAIVEASEDAIFRTDVDGKIQFWSKGAQWVYGYTSEEVLEKNAISLLMPNDSEGGVQILEALSTGNSIIKHNANTLHKGGYVLDVSISVFPISNAKGEVIGGASIHRDMRETRYLEGQLRHAQKMETVGQLAGGIAHDFNNILTVIQGYCDLIIPDLAVGSRLQSQIEAIENAARRASSLTRQLLQFSHRQRVSREVMDPKKLLTELLTVIRCTLGEKIDLTINLRSTWLVKEDPAQFEQIVLNLLVNSRHSMQKGGTLTVESSDVEITEYEGERINKRLGFNYFSPKQVCSGKYVLLSITDTGSGMSKDMLERIFEPFYTTKPSGEGTGLGLSVIYGMLTQGGGAIHVESSEGKGTSFYVYLPMVDAGVETKDSMDATISVDKGKILLVEDDEDVLSLTKAILESSGYTVRTAISPSDVFNKEFTEDFDLVLSDIIMPGMSGPEFYKVWLKTHPDARFLFMSGYADDSILPFSSSPENLLQKPFKREDLLRKVGQIIESDN